MRDDLFDKKVISDIKKKTAADAKLIIETKKMMEESSECEKRIVPIKAFKKVAGMAAVACVGLICGVIAYQGIITKPVDKDKQVEQNKPQQQLQNSVDYADENIVMTGGVDEDDILCSINVIGLEDSEFKMETLEELVENSEEIVKGTVIDCNSDFTDEMGVYTKYHIYVEKVYKGESEKDNVITVAVPGGVIKAQEYIRIYGKDSRIEWDKYTSEELEEGYIEHTLEGEPTVKEGDYCIFMLAKEDDMKKMINNTEDDTIYSTVGNFRGRFIINGDKVERYLPDYEDDMIKIKDVKKLEEKIKG